MKLRILTCIAVLALILLLISCNNGTEAATAAEESTTGADTTVFAETTVEEVTAEEITTEEITTEEITTETETTLSPEEESSLKAEKMVEIAARTNNRVLPIGGWSTPATGLRDGYSEREGNYDEMFRLLADTGINFMFTLEEWSSPYWTLESLSSAKKAGLKLYYNGAGQSLDYTNDKLDLILSSEDADALGGVYVMDEPLYDQLDEIAMLVKGVKAKLGDGSKLPVFANLLPNYAPITSTGDYAKYVSDYIEKSNPDIVMFDFYPAASSKYASFKAMYSNIAAVKEAADKADIDFWFYVKVTSSQAGMLCNAHANLALGGKGMAYFLLCEQYENWGYDHIIGFKGEKTPNYAKVAEVNRQILNMKGVYLDYDCIGVLRTGYKDALTGFKDSSLLLDSFSPLTSAEVDDRTLVTCFEKADGGKAVYLVNTTLNKETSATLNFDSPKSVQIWGGEGLEDIATGASVTVKLPKGAGAFIIIEDIK